MMPPAQLEDARPSVGELAYAEIGPRIRALVEELTPVGAIVMVVSKGDESLLRFEGRSGWHFPRSATGKYAGHHPPDGGWAIDQMEALRAAGAAYLVLPATYFWWLEHYPELGRHLAARYERLPCAEEVCRVYRLLELPTAPARAVPASLDRCGQRQVLPAMRALVGSLLPDEEIVLILSEGDDALLDLDRSAWHFPHDAAGRHVPLEATEAARTVSQLRTLRGQGVKYLVVPAGSYASLLRSEALAEYLGEECRTLALRHRVCVVYELRNGVRPPTTIALRAKEALRK